MQQQKKAAASINQQAGSQNSQKGSQKDWAHYTDMPVGEILRRAREYYGLSILDVEKALHIRSSQLLALEQGDPEKLPGRVYAIGFVRAYAEFLGLDGNQTVHLFKEQIVDNRARPELNFPASASESKLPNLYILSGSFIALLALAVVFIVFKNPAPVKNVPEVPVSIKQAIAEVYGPPAPTSLAAVELAAMMPASGVTEPQNRVIIDVIDNAWVEIRNAEGEALISRVLKKGDSYLVPDEPGMVMDTGNIGVLDFTVDGQKIARLGEAGDVRRNVSLDPDDLLPRPKSLLSEGREVDGVTNNGSSLKDGLE